MAGASALGPSIRPLYLPTSTPSPPGGPESLHEIKHDGYRMLAHHRRRADPPHLAARARLGRSSQPVNALAVRSCIIDSELIVCDANGLADFQLLRRRKRDDPAVLCVFDLIEI